MKVNKRNNWMIYATISACKWKHHIARSESSRICHLIIKGVWKRLHIITYNLLLIDKNDECIPMDRLLQLWLQRHTSNNHLNKTKKSICELYNFSTWNDLNKIVHTSTHWTISNYNVFTSIFTNSIPWQFEPFDDTINNNC